MKKIAVMAISFLLFIPFASINGSNVSSIKNPDGNILYVGGSGPNNYTSITEALGVPVMAILFLYIPGHITRGFQYISQ